MGFPRGYSFTKALVREELASLSTAGAVLCRTGLVVRDAVTSGCNGYYTILKITEGRWWCLLNKIGAVIVMTSKIKESTGVLTPRKLWKYLIEHDIYRNGFNGQPRRVLLNLQTQKKSCMINQEAECSHPNKKTQFFARFLT